jgi:carboxylesterase type B
MKSWLIPLLFVSTLVANRTENLLMNIFQPQGDACSKRPLVIFMHGGWMQGGGRGDETGTAQQFAKRGFVYPHP